MPIYEYQCQPCNRLHEFILSVDKRKTPQYCPECGEYLIKILSAFARHSSWGDWNGAYYDRGLGCNIASASHRKKVMKEKGVRQLEPDELSDDRVDAQIAEAEEHNKEIKRFKADPKKFIQEVDNATLR